MKKKKVSLIISGTGEPQQKDLEIVKGSDRKDLLRAAGLPMSTTLIRKANGEQLRDGQDLYEILEENDMVIATPISDVASLRDFIMSRNLFFSKPKVRVLDTQTAQTNVPAQIPMLVAPQLEQPALTVAPLVTVMPSEMLGQEAELATMGWAKHGNESHSYIIDKNGIQYPAKLVKNYSGYLLYVHNPPQHVFQGPHALCFRPVGDGWYWVHFAGNTNYAPGMIRSAQKLFSHPRRRRF